MEWVVCQDHGIDHFDEEGCPVCRLESAITAAQARLAALEAKLAKRETQLVWAVTNGAYLSHDPEHTEIFDEDLYGEDGKLIDVFTGSTPAGLLAAIDAATEGE